MNREAIVSLAIAPLLARLDEIRSEVASKRDTRASLLEDINSLKSDFQDVANVVKELTGETPEPICADPHATSTKGYAPPDSAAKFDGKIGPNYGQMSVHQAMVLWFHNNGNRPVSANFLADQIGKRRGTVACYLSNFAAFVSIGWGQGWQLAPSAYTSGKVTISLKG